MLSALIAVFTREIKINTDRIYFADELNRRYSRSHSPKYSEFGHFILFRVVVLQRMGRKCTKLSNARAELLFLAQLLKGWIMLPSG